MRKDCIVIFVTKRNHVIHSPHFAEI